MKTLEEVEKKDLDQLQQKAVAKAIRENKALKLAYKTVENGQLVEVAPDGSRSVLGRATFSTVKVQQKRIKLKK